MRFLSQCMTLSAAGLLAVGAASGASAQQQQPRDSSIESGAVTGADTASTPTVGSPSTTTDTGSTVNSGNASQPSSVGQPSTVPDSSVSGMSSDTNRSAVSSDTGMTGVANDTSKSRTSTDTALKAKPGVQTGPVAGDTGGVSATTDTSTSADTSKAANKQHHKKGAKGYKYTGAPSDTTLHAKPGTQTGKSTTDSASARPDSTH